MTTQPTDRLSTGIAGLDEILNGGLIPQRTYMIRGPPGAGKTLFGLQYLRAGVDTDEDLLFIALEEGADDIKQNAKSIGLDTSEIAFLDLSPGSDVFVDDQTYDIFAPDEAEKSTLIEPITDQIEEHKPDRVVLDPATQLRYLVPDDYQFRKKILSFVRFLREQQATVLFTSQDAQTSPDDDLQFLSDGVIDLQTTAEERTLSAPKFRGSDSQSGRHNYQITDNGIAVFPELVPEHYGIEFTSESIPSGVPEIDELLGGGLERGTVTIVSGPTGVGKTTLGTQFMKEAAGRGERSVMYLFEENENTLLQRCSSINIPVREMIDRGTLSIEMIEPLRLSAAEFAQNVRREVENENSEIVMIDGVDGYQMSLHGRENELNRQLHSLCRYLKNMGITVILVDEAGSVSGGFEPSSVNISYIADNIVFIRYLELEGELRKAIGVLKKRTGDFERTLRAFEITEYGLTVGKPLSNLRGILAGTPERIEMVDEQGDRMDGG